ncbi:prepilin-type N-terminal cleavage/methylation domain-containing protein [Patescibacteria group bacterium]|nr:prepilin-type N-terminal cleavage/methylation domain-containing protein [Patescibacteria group bacterium]
MLYQKITKGFSLVELLVSVSIVSMIMGVVLFSYSTFNDGLALQAGGQEMAIAIRQAQTYGLTVKEVITGGGQFGYAYGIYFDTTDPQNYYVFADGNNNKTYDVGSGCGSGSTECVEKFTLRNNVSITSVCDATSCAPSGATQMAITFLRPNPDALIYFIGASGIPTGPSVTGKITLTSAKGKTQLVTVESTGQVLVQ